VVAEEALGGKRTKLEIIREGVVIGGSIGQLFGLAVRAMKSKPAARTAAAVLMAAGVIPRTTRTKNAALTATPRIDNKSLKNSKDDDVSNIEMEDDGTTIGLASLFGQGMSDELQDYGSNVREEDDMTRGIPGIETAQEKWSDMEEMRHKDGYNVRYEYSEKPSDQQRSMYEELYALAEELWRADPEVEMYSFNKSVRPITGIDYFPSSSADYQEFFARGWLLKNGKNNHIFGVFLQTKHPLSKLTQFNDKAVKKFLIGRKT
jgi:hypothetical protein